MATSSLLTGLVSWWDLDDLLDSHGSNDLTNDSGTVSFVNGIPNGGNAADFEADDDNALYVADNASLSFTDSVTFAAWCSFETSNTNRCLIGKYGGAGTRSYHLDFITASSGFQFVTSNNGILNVISSLNDNLTSVDSKPTWYFVIAEWDNSTDTQQVFVNNTADSGSEQTQTGIFDSNTPFAIGGRGAAIGSLGVNNFDGLIDSVACWNRVLTSDEKTRLYNGRLGLEYFDARGVSADAEVRIGGNKVGCSDNDDGTMRFTFSKQESNTISSRKLVLGGRALTLYDIGNGRDALGLYIIDNNTSISPSNFALGPSYVYKGSRLSTSCNPSNGRNYLDFESADSSRTIDHTTVWNGSPIGLTEDTNSIAIRRVNGTIAETDSISIGGIPLTVVRIGSDWYLAGYPKV